MKIADLYAEFRTTGLNTLSSALGSARGQLGAMNVALASGAAAVAGLGHQFMAMGAIMGAPMIGAARAFSVIGDDLAKMSVRTGVAVEALSELKYAASLSGASIGEVEMALRYTARNMQMAGERGGMAAQMFKTMKLNVKDLMALSPEERFIAIAEGISQIADAGERSAMAMRMFGRGGTRMLPMIETGRAGIDELRLAARKQGLTVSTEEARKAEAFNDVLDNMTAVMKNLTFVIGSELSPILTKYISHVVDWAIKAKNWIRDNQGLLESILKLSGILFGLGAALAFVGKIGGMLFGLFSVGIGIISALLSPMGLLITGVAGVAIGLASMSEDAKISFAGLKEGFQAVLADMIIALGAGDVEGAAKIFWLGLELVWVQGCNQLRNAWEDLLLDLTKKLSEGVAGWKIVWNEFITDIKHYWENIKLGSVVIKEGAKLAIKQLVGLGGEDALREAAKKVDAAAVKGLANKKTINEENAAEQTRIINEANQRKKNLDFIHNLRIAAIKEEAEKEKEKVRDRQAWVRFETTNRMIMGAAKGLVPGLNEPQGATAGWAGGKVNAPTAPSGQWVGLAEMWKGIQTSITTKDPVLGELQVISGTLKKIEANTGNMEFGAAGGMP